MSVTAGQTLSHYHLVAPLGTGGMGEVWLAELDQPRVAIVTADPPEGQTVNG